MGSKIAAMVKLSAKTRLQKSSELFSESMEILLQRMSDSEVSEKDRELFRKQATIGADIIRLSLYKLYDLPVPEKLIDNLMPQSGSQTRH